MLVRCSLRKPSPSLPHVFRTSVSSSATTKSEEFRLYMECLESSAKSVEVSKSHASTANEATTTTSNRTPRPHISRAPPPIKTDTVHGRQPRSRWKMIMEGMRKDMGKHSGGPLALLGVESSCDDTAVAVVDERGHVLGEAIHSQLAEHQKTGGIIPDKAAGLHQFHLQRVTELALERSGRSLKEVGGVAVTVGPGLNSCLWEGIKFAKKLAQEAKKPFLPIHHMEAHALTPRLEHDVPFPYLVLLCSGGHCLLAVAHSVTKFGLLGRSLDDSPGEALDKCARMMRLNLHPDLQGLSGGAAIEKLAKHGDRTKVQLMKKNSPIMHSRLCCNFSFSGIKETVRLHCMKTAQMGWDEQSPIPLCEDLAAAFQGEVLDHLVMRTYRAILYCKMMKLPVTRLVASGGVASNQNLHSRLADLAKFCQFDFLTPSPLLCTDNGVMIAWAGMERLKALETGADMGGGWFHGTGVCNWHEDELYPVEAMPRLPLGKDFCGGVEAKGIKVKRNYANTVWNRNSYRQSKQK